MVVVWIIGTGENRAVLYAGCGSVVCGQTVLPTTLSHTKTPPPVRVLSPLVGRYSHIQTSSVDQARVDAMLLFLNNKKDFMADM